jgi:hypothetical protein
VKKDRSREELEAVARAARDPGSPDSLATLRSALRSRSNQVVARAARGVREASLRNLAADVAAAFPRLMADPIARDPTCVGKLEIVRCLLELDHPAHDVFLASVRHVQREPAFGPPVDTAAELRGTASIALVVTRHAEGPYEAVRLLADPEPVARAGACRALAACGIPGAELALRLHVMRGESEPDVAQEALAALLDLDPARSLDLAVELLDGDDEGMAGAAALALGGTRRDAALAPLRTRLDVETRPVVRHAIALALGELRLEEGFAVLLDMVERGSRADAHSARRALEVFPDPELQERLRAAIARRK